MLPDITHLLADYAKAQTKRAHGGLYALAGFDYQLRFYLAQLAEALVIGAGALEEAGRVFVEALSDVAVQKTDRLICIQVKRSLTSSTLRDAAAEFAAIESFFEQKYPAQGSRLQFELVASRSDAGLDWSNLSATAPERKVVDELLRQGRLAQPRVEVDPGWKAIVAVWPHLDDPYGFFRFALDRCLNRSLSPEDAVRARDDICERFARGRRTPAAVGQLLTPTDFVPLEKLTSRLEIGREITLKRMQDQQYMLRRHRRDALFAALEERYELAGNDLQSAARVFWLSGRSGVGKSVLLLQVVERLVHSGRRVLWLGGAAEKLEPTLRLLAEQPDALRPEVIAIDDLYDRDARTRLDLAGLGSFIDEAGPRSWPLILTCGPVEFAEAFRDESRFRGFELHLETIHPVAVDESRMLVDWYRQRMQRAPAMDPGSAPAFAQTQGNDGGLFISLAVELEYGELNEFAHRFAARIALNGLGRALWLPLALNRLYLRAPYDWLGDDDREKLATLNSEGDFSLLEPGEAGQIVRLTHPHLGDALYRAIRKPGNATAYTHDLRNIFQRALQEGNIGLVQQLLRLFSSGHSGMAGERLAIVDRAQLATDCCRIWKEAAVDLGANADMAADMATSWACWAIDEPLIAQQLGADLMHRAIHSLNDATKVWPFCWQRLWDRAIDRTALQTWADHHLHDLQRMWHPGWSFVWEQLHQATAREHWKQLGEAWLAHYTRRADWYFVWKRLLPAPAEADWANDHILLLGQQRLDEGSDGPDWAYVLEDLLPRAAQHPPTATALSLVGWRWLDGREDRAEWSYVWRALLAQPGQLPEGVMLADPLGRGWRWLDGREDRAEWSHVWQALLAQPGQLPEGVMLADLLGRGWRWLADHRNSKEWPVLWWDIAHQRGLLEDQYEALMKMGVDWLTMAGHLEMLETSRFVEGLLEMGCREPRFIALAVRWLQGSSDERPWPIIAAKFVAAAPFDAAAGELATELMRRIRACPNNGVWMKITRIMDGLARTGTTLPPPVTTLLEALNTRSTEPVWERARELQQSGTAVQGRVVAVKPDFLSVELDIGLLAVLSRQRGNRNTVGEVISAAILKIIPEKGRVTLGATTAQRGSYGTTVTMGSICDGTVTGARDYGLFIQVGRQSGLLHHSKMPDPAGFRTRYPIGIVLRVRVLEINAKGLVLEFAA